MYSMRNGVFAKSIFGKGSCFERIAQCACRPKQKPPPKDSSKRPFGPAAPKVVSEKQRYLLSMINRGCSCPKTDAKGRWFDVNRHIILSLAISLNRPPDVVLDFLYSLTMQNFRKIIDPYSSRLASPCNVPFTNGNICTQYMSIFDTRGNVRNPFHKNSLQLLMRLIQTMLGKGESRQRSSIRDFLVSPNAPHDRDAERAKRAGIDSSSAARQNGKRRLREADFRAQEIRRILYNEVPERPFGIDVGADFWKAVEPRTLQDFNLNDFNFDELGVPGGFSTIQAEELTAMIDLLNQRILVTRHPNDLIQAIKSLDLEPTHVHKTTAHVEKTYAKEISKNYNEAMAATPSQPKFKERLASFHRSTMTATERKANENASKMAKKSHYRLKKDYHMYLGEQIPVLIHEPYDPQKPWTWMRRHPKQSRLDTRVGTMGHVNIARYHRASVKEKIEKSQETASIHTVFSVNEEDPTMRRLPMFGESSRKSGIK